MNLYDFNIIKPLLNQYILYIMIKQDKNQEDSLNQNHHML